MEKLSLYVQSNCKNSPFGLVLEADPQYGQAYVLDVNKKSSAAHSFSSLKATPKAIKLSYNVEIAGHCIFSKSEASTTLAKLRNAGVSQFHIIFAVEPTLTATQKRHNANEFALFVPNTKWSGNKLPTSDLNVAKLETKSSAKTKSQSKSNTKSQSKFNAKFRSKS